jgi:hypothetical protein
MMAVPPAIPVTTPELLTLATALLEVVHTPFGVVLAKVMLEFIQTELAPVMAGTTGNGLTVTTLVTVVTQLLLLVTV